MSDPRQTISWLLVAMLAVVGGGAAVLGVSQAPSNVPLQKAVANTLAAANYNEVVTEVAAQGTQTDYLTFVAPSTLGGYVQNGDQRTYVYVIGNTDYQSLTVPAGTSAKHLTFYAQASESAAIVDPARNYLRYAAEARHVSQTGSSYTFALSQEGQIGHFTYTVSGHYVSEIGLTVATSSVHVIISQVGSSPPVGLPKGATIKKAPVGRLPG